MRWKSRWALPRGPSSTMADFQYSTWHTFGATKATARWPAGDGVTDVALSFAGEVGTQCASTVCAPMC
jgi:hypothetical protein